MPLRALLLILIATTLAAGDAPARVLVLAERGFNVQEAWAPWVALTAAGYDLEIASTRSGTVSAALDGTPSERDLVATRTIAGADPAGYALVFVPGGHSPGFLEQDPDAVGIVRAQAASGRPLALICHGPRLLIAAGAARDQVITSLHTVPDEMAERWRERAYGTWIDEPVVVDGPLITSRSPIDVTPFSAAMLDRLAAATGRPQPWTTARLLVIAPGSTPHQRWLWRGLEPLGITAVATEPAGVQKALGEGPGFDFVAVLGLGEGDAALAERLRAGTAAILAATAVADRFPGATTLPDGFADRLRAVAQASERFQRFERRPPAPPPVLTIAVAPGFPAAAYAAAITALPATAPVRVVAARPGAVAGVDGAALADADAGSAAPVRLTLGPAGVQWSAPAPVWESAVAAAMAAPGPAPATAAEILAIAPGFDPLAVAAIRGRLAGAPLLIVGPAGGPVPGLNGATLTAHRAYADAPAGAGQRMWMPGVLWPRLRSEARQAATAAGRPEQDRQDRARRDWFHAGLAAGANAVTVGFDGLRLGNDPRARDLRVASSSQTLWSFAKGNARFLGEPVVQTTSAWISVAHWRDLARLAR
jgi:protease I